MLHRCIEGEKVGDDGSKIVDVDRRHDPCPSGVPAPPRERGGEPHSFFLLGLPPRWKVSSTSGPWPPWRWRGGSPFEIGSIPMFSSVSRSCFLALHRFLNTQRSITPFGLKFWENYYPWIIFIAAKEGLQLPYEGVTRHNDASYCLVAVGNMP